MDLVNSLVVFVPPLFYLKWNESVQLAVLWGQRSNTQILVVRFFAFYLTSRRGFILCPDETICIYFGWFKSMGWENEAFGSDVAAVTRETRDESDSKK